MQRFRARPFHPSLSASQSRILPLPREIPLDVEPPILVGSSWYSVISTQLLYTWTLAVESTSQQFSRRSSIVSTLGCQLSISGATGISFCSDSAGVAIFLKLRFDPHVLIWRSEYFAQSSGCLTQYQSGKCVVTPLSIHS